MEEDPKIIEAEKFKNLVAEYAKSIELYSQAISILPNSNKTAIYYSNRAFAHIRQENYGLAIADADEAIKLDPTYSKAYYRKADANIIIDKYDVAKVCLRKVGLFKKVVKEMGIKDKDAIDKYNFVIKVLKERAFSEAIFVEEKVVSIDPNEITVLPLFRVEKLLSYLADQKKLHLKYLVSILNECKKIFKATPNINQIHIKELMALFRTQEITVCGDTHGQFYDLLNIFKINGNPSKSNPYIFNGDFVDRGSFSLEVILTLLTWKVSDPECMYLTRGNHEAKNMNKIYGFEGEILHKYNSKVYDLFADLFCALPLACKLNNDVLILHGGLFAKDGVTLDDINKVNRFMEPPDAGIMTDMLWADPCKEQGRHPSKRGISMQFGPDIAHKFLNENKLRFFALK